jgi:hypothetical protein
MTTAATANLLTETAFRGVRFEGLNLLLISLLFRLVFSWARRRFAVRILCRFCVDFSVGFLFGRGGLFGRARRLLNFGLATHRFGFEVRFLRYQTSG